MPDTYSFYRSCVDWPRSDVGALRDMIDNAKDITRRTFLKHVDLDQLKETEANLGYDKHLRMKDDYHVSYHRSTLHGKRVYYFKWSGIEHVFTKQHGN